MFPCQTSICKALDPSKPDYQVWLDSYNKEKLGIIYHEVYEKTPKSHYLALKRADNIPKATLSMYVLVLKNKKDGKPLRAKYRIVVIGNFEDCLYQNPQHYAPILK